MNNVEKIKQEAQNLRDKLNDRVNENEFIAGEVFILNYFLSYINLHNEPVSEELEKEVDEYILDNFDDAEGRVYVLQCARHFAEWQKEQMMAKAIDATIEEPEPLLWRVLGELEGLFVAENNLHDGDGVKVIIVKED